MRKRYIRQAAPLITIDVERYDHLLADTDLSPEERQIVLQELWNLIVAFIDFGFRVEPLESGCGQVSEGEENATVGGADPVNSEDQFIEKFLAASFEGEPPGFEDSSDER